MLKADVVIAGGGVAGLLMANAFSPSVDVVLLERQQQIPRGKYWLTDQKSLALNNDLIHCIDRKYQSMDFIAYDGLTCSLGGPFNLWDTERLVSHLIGGAEARGVRIMTDQRLYSLKLGRDRVIIRVNSEDVHAKVLIDCMGIGSPIVSSKGVVDVTGYYFVHGSEVLLTTDVEPVGLDNVILSDRPTFFELFPTSCGTAHAAIIAPSYSRRTDRPLKDDFNFVIQRSHYSKVIEQRRVEHANSYFGIIPVGRLRTPALDRIVFFGESGQLNPGTSATALTTMLRSFRAVGQAVEHALAADRLTRRELVGVLPIPISPLNRKLQEALFERVLSFDSDGFRELVETLRRCPNDVVSDLVFASFDFSGERAAAIAAEVMRSPRGLLTRSLARATARLLRF